MSEQHPTDAARLFAKGEISKLLEVLPLLDSNSWIRELNRMRTEYSQEDEPMVFWKLGDKVRHFTDGYGSMRAEYGSTPELFDELLDNLGLLLDKIEGAAYSQEINLVSKLLQLAIVDAAESGKLRSHEPVSLDALVHKSAISQMGDILDFVEADIADDVLPYLTWPEGFVSRSFGEICVSGNTDARTLHVEVVVGEKVKI